MSKRRPSYYERIYAMNLRRLINAAGGRCHYCMRQVTRRTGADTDASVDHFVPKSRGGSDHISNLRLACQRCNSEKGDLMALEITTG